MHIKMAWLPSDEFQSAEQSSSSLQALVTIKARIPSNYNDNNGIVTFMS